jgi:hypothetical protein
VLNIAPGSDEVDAPAPDEDDDDDDDDGVLADFESLLHAPASSASPTTTTSAPLPRLIIGCRIECIAVPPRVAGFVHGVLVFTQMYERWATRD